MDSQTYTESENIMRAVRKAYEIVNRGRSNDDSIRLSSQAGKDLIFYLVFIDNQSREIFKRAGKVGATA